MRPGSYRASCPTSRPARACSREAGTATTFSAMPCWPDRVRRLACAHMRATHSPEVKKIDDREARIRRLDADAIAAIRSPLTGEELMARTGRPAGSWIKRVKSALEDAIVDGTLPPDAQSSWRYLEAHPELLEG